MKNYIISILSVVLFCSGYWICEVVFPNDLTSWWRLRMALTTVDYALCFTIGYLFAIDKIKPIFLIGMVFCAGDIVDRYIFSINEFQYNDLLLYIFAIYYTYISYARKTKTSA